MPTLPPFCFVIIKYPQFYSNCPQVLNGLLKWSVHYSTQFLKRTCDAKMVCLAFSLVPVKTVPFHSQAGEGSQHHAASPWQLWRLAYFPGPGNPISMCYSRAPPLTLRVGVSGSLKVKPPQNVLFLGHELSLLVTSLSAGPVLCASVFLVSCRGPCLALLASLSPVPRPLSLQLLPVREQGLKRLQWNMYPHK